MGCPKGRHRGWPEPACRHLLRGRRTRRAGRDEAKLKAHLDRLRQALDHYARIYRVPYIFIARPGTFSSTGAHQERRGVREVHVLNAALDRFRARHRIERVTLTGQSGGATVAAALLTLGRTDVDCATPASGGYDLPGLLEWHAEKQGRDGSHRSFPAILSKLFNVMDHIDGIRPSPKRRIFVIGYRDQVTPFVLQQKFAQQVRPPGTMPWPSLPRAGGRIGMVSHSSACSWPGCAPPAAATARSPWRPADENQSPRRLISPGPDASERWQVMVRCAADG